MKNLFTAIGFITTAVKGYEWFREYSDLKREKAEREAAAGKSA